MHSDRETLRRPPPAGSDATRASLPHPDYRADIDGLRAIAVGAVVIFHAFPAELPGGFIGVDIFFVISGYLISAILYTGLGTNRFDLKQFYARRIRRLFPALVTVLLFTLAAGWLLLIDQEFSQLGKHTATGAGFVANFMFWSEAGYFDTAAHSKALLHLWSLGVEEQFYIVWPLLLVLCWRWQWRLLPTTLLLLCLSLTASIVVTAVDSVAAFYAPITRFWELLTGALLALLLRYRPGIPARWAGACSALGILLLALAFAALDADSQFPGWWALLPTLGTALLIVAGPVSPVNRWLLSRRPMVQLGLISYPLYLWHWPLLVFTHLLEPDPAKGRLALVIVMALLLAWGTYRFVERPLRFTRSPAVDSGLVTAMVALLATGLLINSGAIAPRNDHPRLQPLLAAGGDWDFPGDLQRLSDDDSAPLYRAQAQRAESVLFVGDSHVQQYGSYLANIVKTHSGTAYSAVLAVTSGCPPIPGVGKDNPGHGHCALRREQALALVDRDEVAAVVIGGCWNCYFVAAAGPREPGGENNFYTLAEGEKHYFRGGDGVTLALAQLEQLLAAIASHKPVYLLLDNPLGDRFAPHTFYRGDRLTGLTTATDASPRIHQEKRQIALHRRLTTLAHRAGAGVLDPRASLCNEAGCLRLNTKGEPLYSDNNHLRPQTVRAHGEFLLPLLLPGRRYPTTAHDPR